MDAVGQALNTTGVILSGLFTLTAILLIGFYWTLEGEGALHTLLRPLSSDKRESAHEMLQEIGTRVGGYVRGQGILAVTIGVADLVVYLLIGLPAALAVALLAGLFELIPVLGPTLGAIPAVLVAFAYDPSKVVWVIAAGALIQLLENNVLAPRVMHKTVGVNPDRHLVGDRGVWRFVWLRRFVVGDPHGGDYSNHSRSIAAAPSNVGTGSAGRARSLEQTAL